MRRKNRKWVATAVVLYLGVMWLAYRWGIHQRPTNGPLLEQIENEAVRKGLENARKKPASKFCPARERIASTPPAPRSSRHATTRPT